MHPKKVHFYTTSQLRYPRFGHMCTSTLKSRPHLRLTSLAIDAIHISARATAMAIRHDYTPRLRTSQLWPSRPHSSVSSQLYLHLHAARNLDRAWVLLDALHDHLRLNDHLRLSGSWRVSSDRSSSLMVMPKRQSDARARRTYKQV